ncbi:b29f935e-0d0f-448a-93c7-e4b30d5efc30 [Thermothielavioides terrestris]|uniref:B29f935e-0d0f-448a-93c7-e4b30d5efc30 n=1 Tax=Thermothielavioides terrestris TaxID=2587410 RepID=A0A3S4B0P4_9PEZI|nr:b29f935e-0d0f-448a-93c7-e4b30d5efc30 [Thermothielavioides terrestris]
MPHTVSMFTRTSCNPEPDLLRKVLRHRRAVIRAELVHLLLAGQHVDVLCLLSERRAEPQLVPQVQQQKGRDRDVRGQKVLIVPPAGREHLEPVGERQQDDDGQRGPRGVRLRDGAERQGVQQALDGQRGTEAQVGHHDDDPGDEARNGRHVGEPAEDAGAVLRHVEVGQQADGPGGEDGEVGHAAAVGAGEDAGRLARGRHRVQHARARVQEGVAGGPGRRQDRRVDDVVQPADAGALDADDPRARVGVGLGRQQVRVIRGHDGADDQGADAVEEREAGEEAAGGLGDVAAGGHRLAGGQTDEFRGRDEAEAGSDKRGPVGGEAPRRAGPDVFLEGARVMPVMEPDRSAGGCAAGHDDDAHDHQAEDRDELDAGEPELGLAKDRDGEDVQQQNHEQDDGDPDGRRDGRVPVLEQDGTGGRLCRNQDRIGVPVVPS